MPGAKLFLGWSFTMVKSKGKKQIRWEYHSLVGGIPIPLKKKYEFVSWDDYIFPTEWKFIKKNVPNHQPDIFKATHVSRGNLSFVEHHLLGE